MSRGALTFKQTDVTRAVKAVTAAGLEVARVEVDKGGRIIVITGKSESTGKPNPWDDAIRELQQ